MNIITSNLFNWFMRRTKTSGIRRVADLPVAIATDMGLVRTENQDRTAVFRIKLANDKPIVIAVLCDVMEWEV